MGTTSKSPESNPRPRFSEPSPISCLPVLRPDHPHTLNARDNLTYWRQQSRDAGLA